MEALVVLIMVGVFLLQHKLAKANADEDDGR